MVKTTVTQVVLLQPMEVHSGAGGCALIEAAACEQPMLEQGSGTSCDPLRGVHTEAGFLAGHVAYGGPTLE